MQRVFPDTGRVRPYLRLLRRRQHLHGRDTLQGSWGRHQHPLLTVLRPVFRLLRAFSQHDGLWIGVHDSGLGCGPMSGCGKAVDLAPAVHLQVDHCGQQSRARVVRAHQHPSRDGRGTGLVPRSAAQQKLSGLHGDPVPIQPVPHPGVFVVPLSRRVFRPARARHRRRQCDTGVQSAQALQCHGRNFPGVGMRPGFALKGGKSPDVSGGGDLPSNTLLSMSLRDRIHLDGFIRNNLHRRMLGSLFGFISRHFVCSSCERVRELFLLHVFCAEIPDSARETVAVSGLRVEKLSQQKTRKQAQHTADNVHIRFFYQVSAERVH